MELVKLKEYIKARLTNLSDITVYDGEAAENADFPYLIYKIPSTSFLVNNRDDRILEIDWYGDSSTDYETILSSSNQVRKGKYTGEVLTYPGLDKSYETESEGFYKAEIEFDGEIPTQERNLYRHNQRYLLKVY